VLTPPLLGPSGDIVRPMAQARNWIRAWAGVTLLVVAGCGTPDRPTPAAAPQATTTTATTTERFSSSASAAPPVATRTEKWVDLQVGDCVAAVPMVDLGEVDATVVDCSGAHLAEVFLLAPIPVNAALTGVADQRCAAGLPSYAGPSARYSVTYLIDSRQDRTSDNPLPSTVICLLQDQNGAQLTGSGRAGR
jgi:hypothetical protein